MRNDLLGAQASVTWAKSNFPAFQDRLNLWVQTNVSTEWVETDPQASHDVIVVAEKEPLPLILSAEAGAYINAIRSSLDMVAWAVFKRDVLLKPNEVYFPIAESEEAFVRGSYKGLSLYAYWASSPKGLQSPRSITPLTY